MPSSWSPSLRFELQFTGENINLWGDKLNVVLQHVDYAVAGWLNKAITGDYALTTANAADDEARAAMIKFSGALSANATITVPPVSKSYFLFNNTNKVLTITTGSGSTVTIDAGDKLLVACDGANVHHAFYFGGYGLKDYITAQTASAGAVPGTTGHLGKFLKVTADGGAPTWQQVSVTDIQDYSSLILGVQVALAVAL